MSELCACGLPLHYTDPATRDAVQAFVDELGPTILVKVAGQPQSVKVPRHYIGLHQLKASEVLTLAELYGWEIVRET